MSLVKPVDSGDTDEACGWVALLSRGVKGAAVPSGNNGAHFDLARGRAGRGSYLAPSCKMKMKRGRRSGG